MSRLLSSLTLWLLLLVAAQPASGMMGVSPENRVWDFFAPEPVSLWEMPSSGQYGTREAEGYGYEFASDVCDGPNLYAYVKQNPWSAFDPKGLSGDRVDPDGFKWSDRDHHVVPAQVARDARWDKSAKEVFDKAKIETPNGHNFRAHGHYNREVAAEMAEFMGEHAPDGLDGMSAKKQRELAEQFIDTIKNTENSFIKGFNEAVTSGPSGVDKWFNKAGKNMVLKSTGIAASKGGKIVSGIAKGVSFGGKLMKGVPIISGVIVGGGALLQGKTANEAGVDVLMSVTGGDVAQWALESNPITKAGAHAIEGHNNQIKEALRGTPFEDAEE